MIKDEIIEELKQSNQRMLEMLSSIKSEEDLKRFRCELLKTLELLPTKGLKFQENC
ncbi:MAG: hypothetical protein K9K67_00595 [Bacteriovoracaceae bacterium]|nr:hypothetical protein [Bacteriovoracaceae bacterium]